MLTRKPVAEIKEEVEIEINNQIRRFYFYRFRSGALHLVRKRLSGGTLPPGPIRIRYIIECFSKPQCAVRWKSITRDDHCHRGFEKI